MSASLDSANSVSSIRHPAPLPVSRKANQGRFKGGARKEARGRMYGNRSITRRVVTLSESDDLYQKVSSCCAVLLEIFVLYGFQDDKGGKYSILADIKRYVKIISEYKLHWITVFKYKLASFSAWAFDSTELPDSPFPAGSTDDHPFLLGRKAKAFVLSLRRGDQRVWRSFVASIAQAKKGFPRASSQDLKEAAMKTFTSLTNVPERKTLYLLNRDRIHPFLSLDLLKDQVERTVSEIFSDFTIGSFTEEMFTPSINANYNFTNSELGTLGLFVEQGLLNDWVDSDDSLFLKEVFRKLKVVELLALDDDNHVTTVLELEEFSRLRTIFDRLYWKAYEYAVKEVPLAQPVPLAESLKVRVITKGPPYTYFVLKAFQRKIHSHLRRHPMFRLIGEPISQEIINSVFTSPERFIQKGQSILSVDYSSATDKIDPDLSEICVHKICDIIGCEKQSTLRTLFINSMTRHHMTIVNNEGERITKPQLSGQLMGSIVSFPILCIINAAVMRTVAEIAFNRPQTLRTMKCLINGDDAVLLTNDVGREAWYKLAPIAGLYPSIGKILYSNSILNMNSTYFALPTHSQKERKFELVPYVNMGLVYGLKRSSGKIGAADLFDSLSNVGSRHRDLYRSSPFWLWEKVNALFIKKHKPIFDKISKAIPWYIPECFGGLGMVGQPSKVDLRIVSALIAGRHSGKDLPLLSHSRQSTSISAFALSQIPEELSFRYVHPKDLSLLDIELQQDFDALFNHLCVWSVLCHANSIVTERKSNILSALKHNETLWTRMMKASRSKSDILNRYSRVILPDEDPMTVGADVLIGYERVPNFFVRYSDIS